MLEAIAWLLLISGILVYGYGGVVLDKWDF